MRWVRGSDEGADEGLDPHSATLQPSTPQALVVSASQPLCASVSPSMKFK